MGLDMYLFKSKKELHSYDDEDTEYCKQIAYWRKCNAIHKWFVDNVQNGVDDCGYYKVTIENLKDLLEICKKVLDTKEVKLLPTQDGFMFGNTDYGSAYFYAIEYTIDELDRVITECENEKEHYLLYYSSSW